MPTHVPNVTFMTRVRDESIGGDNPFKWLPVTSDDLFKGKDDKWRPKKLINKKKPEPK